MENNPFAVAQKVAADSGYQYEELDPQIWRFLFAGKHMPEIDVIAVWQGQLFILGAILTSRQFLRESMQFMEQLLFLNNNLDRVKIGYNHENMLFVRVDLSVRNLDPQEFKDALDQVSAATDFVYGAIKPFLIAPPAAYSSPTPPPPPLPPGA